MTTFGSHRSPLTGGAQELSSGHHPRQPCPPLPDESFHSFLRKILFCGNMKQEDLENHESRVASQSQENALCVAS